MAERFRADLVRRAEEINRGSLNRHTAARATVAHAADLGAPRVQGADACRNEPPF
jgi:hypothetical protein